MLGESQVDGRNVDILVLGDLMNLHAISMSFWLQYIASMDYLLVMFTVIEYLESLGFWRMLLYNCLPCWTILSETGRDTVLIQVSAGLVSSQVPQRELDWEVASIYKTGKCLSESQVRSQIIMYLRFYTLGSSSRLDLDRLAFGSYDDHVTY